MSGPVSDIGHPDHARAVTSASALGMARELVAELCRLRRDRGLTRRHIEALTGIGRRQQRRIENGGALPGLLPLIRFAEAVGKRPALVANTQRAPDNSVLPAAREGAAACEQ